MSFGVMLQLGLLTASGGQPGLSRSGCVSSMIKSKCSSGRSAECSIHGACASDAATGSSSNAT